MNLQERLKIILESFDNFNLDNPYERRLAVKPLYDYYSIVLLEAGVNFCHLFRDTLNRYSLSSRWHQVSYYFNLVEKKSDEWKSIVQRLQNIRDKITHRDYYEPKKQELLSLRLDASKFFKWVTEAGSKYFQQSEGFSFIDKYARLSHTYSRRCSDIKHQYGNATPLIVQEDLPALDNNIYNQLFSMRDRLQTRLPELRNVHDFIGEDLDNLVTLIREVERIDAREDAYLKFSICPKCGGKILETQEAIGGSPSDPAPSAIHYRVGCSSCDFELLDEYVDI